MLNATACFTYANSTPVLGIPVDTVDTDHSQAAVRRYYCPGQGMLPLDDSAQTKERILTITEFVCPSQRLHMLKDHPFESDSDREYDWLSGHVYLRNEKVRMLMQQALLSELETFERVLAVMLWSVHMLLRV